MEFVKSELKRGIQLSKDLMRKKGEEIEGRNTFLYNTRGIEVYL